MEVILILTLSSQTSGELNLKVEISGTKDRN